MDFSQMTKYGQNVTKMIKLGNPQFKHELEAFISFIKLHIDLFFAWINTRGFEEVINAHQNIFQGYLKARTKEAKSAEPKSDGEFVPQREHMVDKDGLLELEKAFQKL